MPPTETFLALLKKSLRSPGAPMELNQVKIDLFTSFIQSLGFCVDRTQVATTATTSASGLSGTADLHEWLQVPGQAGQKVLVFKMTELDRVVKYLNRQKLPGLGTAFSVNLMYKDLKNQYDCLQVSDFHGVLHVPETQLLPAPLLFTQLLEPQRPQIRSCKRPLIEHQTHQRRRQSLLSWKPHRRQVNPVRPQWRPPRLSKTTFQQPPLINLSSKFTDAPNTT